MKNKNKNKVISFINNQSRRTKIYFIIGFFASFMTALSLICATFYYIADLVNIDVLHNAFFNCGLMLSVGVPLYESAVLFFVSFLILIINITFFSINFAKS
ncbi:MAG: hypothetical protein IJT65_06240, partial [Eubacterium sp.]|nr:hypothetical protein [Eubacterium sp.]